MAGLQRRFVRTVISDGSGGNPTTHLLGFDTHNLVIMRGVQTFSELWALRRYTEMTQSPGIAGGWVGVPFKTIGDAIWTALTASPAFSLGKPCIFAGHSLGGSIAQYLAYKWKLAAGYKDYSAISIGGTRIGNNVFAVFGANKVYRVALGIDPITQIPESGTWTLQVPGTPTTFRSTWTPYVHGGNLLYYPSESGRGLRFVPNAWHGAVDFLEERCANGENHVFVSELGRRQVSGAGERDHSLWTYTQRLRERVEGPAFQVTTFDEVNDQINAAAGQTWDDPSVKLTGREKSTRALPEDPEEEVLPWPSVLRQGLPAVPTPVPSGGPLPPSPLQIQERRRRQRRNIG